MNKDNSESAFPEKFAFDIRNMRIDARNENTLLSLTNEKGNRLIQSESYQTIYGNPLGYAVINDRLILFTHNPNTQTDYIYKITTDGNWFDYHILFEGDLDFKENWKQKKPIETLAWYESEDIQKVYWLDGIHQPRMINVASNTTITSIGVTYYGYDFIQKLQLLESVDITQGDNGQFHSGIVQYFITYYNKNGTESNIAWQSSLLYVAYNDRGGSLEDIVPKSFTLRISNVDQNYDFMRLYCIQRTTLNGEVYVRKVHDFPKGTPTIDSYTDNGIVGELVDATYLMYVGGDELIAGCFTQKDQVLFFGDIKLQNLFELPTNISDNVGVNLDTTTSKIVPEDEFTVASGKYYHHFLQFNKQNSGDMGSLYYNNGRYTHGNGTVSTFKYLETYRFGIQFQYDNGRWSNVLYVGDKKIDYHIQDDPNNVGAYRFAMPTITLTSTFINSLPNKDRIKRVRPVCVYPSAFERDVICQGILCPTVYNVNDRISGRTFSYGSWFSRPMAPDDIKLEYDGNGNIIYPENLNLPYTQANYPLNPYAVRTPDFKEEGCWAEFRHNDGIPGPQNFNGEIQMQFRDNGGMCSPLIDALYDTPTEFNNNYANGFNIDQSIFTMHSPDIEFNENIQNTALKNTKLRIIGYIPIHANSGDIKISATSVGKYKAYKWRIIDDDNGGWKTDYVEDIYGVTSPEGFYSEKVGVKVNSDYGWFNLINGPYWQDKLYNPSFVPHDYGSSQGSSNEVYPTAEYIKYGFIVYPWQQHGSLSNGNPDDEYSILKTKIISNLKYSRESVYFEPDNHYTDTGYWTSFNEEYDGNDTGLSDVSYIDSINHFTMLQSPYNTAIGYDGNMDKILAYNKNDWSPKMTVMLTSHTTHIANGIGYVSPDYESDGQYGPVISAPVNTYPLPIYEDYTTFHNFNVPTTLLYTNQNIYDCYNNSNDIPALYTGDYNDPADYQNNWHSYYYNAPTSKYLASNTAGYVEYAINSTQPIAMKYKCSPHIVMALNNQQRYEYEYNNNQISLNHLQRCLPTACKKISDGHGGYIIQPINPIQHSKHSIPEIYHHTTVNNFLNGSLHKLYYDPYFDDNGLNSKSMQGCMQAYVNQALFIDESNPEHIDETHGFYWLAELYRDDAANKFGGTSDEALMNNVWHVCGAAVDIDNNKAPNPIICTEGDTFYQRYDHLKTLPYSENDENQVIEIVSFMCESRVNLDGRYDKLRGVDNAELIVPETFNSINTVYSQLDNYLTQSYIREEDIRKYLPNTVIWTGKKINGEDVDIWTQLHTENYLDLEGSNGKINALKTFRNEIYAFQNSAIANILFNSRTALATTEGSPVQLATTGLVEGKQYITNSMGCLNKWSICETPIGLVFTDDLNKSIMAIGDGFDNLSEKYGMSTWIQENTSTVPWDLDFSNMVTYYDRNNKDILFITNDEALAYSVKLGTFTSFYSYEGVPFIVNYKDRVIDIIGNGNNTELWGQNLGPYNSFFGEYQPFGVTLVVNDNPVTDKIFNTIEYRADFFDSNGIYEANNTFSSMRAWNEYQDTLPQPIGNVAAMYPNDVKKKFRMWRLNIPRNYGTMDRIRNPWTYIKLEKDTQGYAGKMQLHDIQVHYTE